MEGEKHIPPTLFAKQAERATLGSLPSYFHVLLRTAKASTPYAIYEKMRSIFRPTIWIARALRILRITLLVIEASALLVFAAAFLLLLLPFALAFFLALWQATLRERRRMNCQLAPYLTGRRVVVFFSGGEGMAASLVGRYTVLVVQDDLPGRRHPAAVATAGREGVILVRMHYFFYLRRTLLRRSSRLCLVF